MSATGWDKLSAPDLAFFEKCLVPSWQLPFGAPLRAGWGVGGLSRGRTWPDAVRPALSTSDPYEHVQSLRQRCRRAGCCLPWMDRPSTPRGAAVVGQALTPVPGAGCPCWMAPRGTATVGCSSESWQSCESCKITPRGWIQELSEVFFFSKSNANNLTAPLWLHTYTFILPLICILTLWVFQRRLTDSML